MSSETTRVRKGSNRPFPHEAFLRYFEKFIKFINNKSKYNFIRFSIFLK